MYRTYIPASGYADNHIAIIDDALNFCNVCRKYTMYSLVYVARKIFFFIQICMVGTYSVVCA